MTFAMHRGAQALSVFRAQRLMQRIRAAGIAIDDLSARFVHLLDWSGAPTEQEQRLAERLLDYGEAWKQDCGGMEIAVVPRLGTISPWSSKATEIAQVCGLSSLRRVERGIAFYIQHSTALLSQQRAVLLSLLHDPLTESVLEDWAAADAVFAHPEPRRLRRIPFLREGMPALLAVNEELGLALSSSELEYLEQLFRTLQRDPSDAELMMFAQANSEHCRHKVFNADFRLDGIPQQTTLFGMIRSTHAAHPEGTLSAYHDNAAVIAAHAPSQYFAVAPTGSYQIHEENLAILIKVETHNHPTAISPFPGAATGSGGEIRDEAATGRGGKAKMGLCGFSVSQLRIPGYEQAWEKDFYGRSPRIRSALEIMLEGPIGAAAFNNEFGRASVAGYFRVFEGEAGGRHWGYHKPIMLAGGVGQIRPELIHKRPLPVGAKVLVLGGPAMLIGLGGGAASSVASGSGEEGLDFASVQRGNPEMQRRAQEVIERCNAMGADSPILAIHDVGAGGLANAVPELLHDGGRGGSLQLRAIPNEDPAMSPMEIWCNEAQERYVLAVLPERLDEFLALCARERCPVAVLGEAEEGQRLHLQDTLLGDDPVDLSLDALLGCLPRMQRDAQSLPVPTAALVTAGVDLREAAYAVLRHPTVASKEFLITIGDRSVGGLIARDQMVGPWQVPVADCAVAAGDFWHLHGEAMAMGERGPVAVLDAPASGRLALAEALTNLFAADVQALGHIKLSANWMAAVNVPGEDARLYQTVRTIAEELCPALELSIPVGKDSLSMQSVWSDNGVQKSVTSPLSVVITAVAPVADVTQTWTPQLQAVDDSQVWLLDLGRGRLGASIFAEVLGQIGAEPADLDDPKLLRATFDWLRRLREQGIVLAYHDRSDGGLWASLCEMSFAGRRGLRISIPEHADSFAFLFAEEPGVLLQVRASHAALLRELAASFGLQDHLHCLGEVQVDWRLRVEQGDVCLLDEAASELLRAWAETSYRMQALRDDPAAAEEAYAQVAASSPSLYSNWQEGSRAAFPSPALGQARPRVAILREEGVNGQIEMAAAFVRCGFDAVDVHMSDLLCGRDDIRNYPVFAACGGFSYGDVLGAGAGWAKSILYHPQLRDQFADYFADSNRLALGVCNGCQMLAELRELIPGAAGWPRFRRNRSEQFEARLAMVEVLPSPSLLFAGLEGLRAPIVIAHGEGRAEFSGQAANETPVVLRYIDAAGEVAQRYPANPNGSPAGITGLCSEDGRISILMPHPERVVRSAQMSWHPADWGADSPWLEIFRNAYRGVS
ncbi:phosphoribosylformylglycinamidine synthase [Candidatus Igneacidithiobacillus taiwanensis]|uniref:phosphoribosylformylglycinamidine synthase n=1 Tax=Candidatus Igneacidithiobacillus taiwanensis TaxID=1945924 RepID=UPI00289E3595|nr:phosphoribosylformylglycinamidine synthase [Candidatus Igneacidithiobacillus taiwanensis]